MFDYEKIQSLNDLELSVYNYIIQNSHEVLKMTIKDLANNAHVSTTTVLRFCKKMKCDGYSEFKVKFKLYLDDQKDIDIEDDLDEIIDSLKKYKEVEFQKSIENIVNIIENSNGTLWVGLGTSGVLCRYGARYLSGTGKFSLAIDDPYFQIEGNIFEKCTVIALSVSGEIDQTIRIVNTLKSLNCKVISITNKTNCTLAKISDYNISYYVPYLKHNMNDMTTQMPVMYIIESIGKRLFKRKFV